MDKVKKIIDYINRFVQSDYFILLNALIIILGWSLGIWPAMLCVLLLIGIIPLFLGKGTKHLLSTLMMFSLIISANRHRLDSFAWLLFLIPVLFAGLIFNLVFFKRKFDCLKPKKIKGFHLSLFLIIIPFALGGVASPYEKPLAVLAALALIILIALGYTFFMVTNIDHEDKKSLMDYALKTLTVMGVIICIQMTILFAGMGSIENIAETIANGKWSIDVGWAGANNVGITIAMIVPATLYMCIRKNYATPLFVLLALYEIVLVFATHSRGSIMTLCALILPITLYVMVKTKNKVLFGSTISIAVVVGGILAIWQGDAVLKVLTSILDRGFDTSGRFGGLFVEAIDVFKKWPVFGAGWDYQLGELANDNYSPYWYHSTALQVMATMGIVGIMAFAVFYFFRYRTFIKLAKENPSAVALGVATLIFDIYGMMDTSFFGPTFFIMLTIMTFVVEINMPKRMSKMERDLATYKREQLSDASNDRQPEYNQLPDKEIDVVEQADTQIAKN